MSKQNHHSVRDSPRGDNASSPDSLLKDLLSERAAVVKRLEHAVRVASVPVLASKETMVCNEWT